MAADTIVLEVVTPTGVALREQVSDVTAPSVDGEFGVLPGHLPLLAALKTGLVTYHHNGQEHRFAVHHGFVEVNSDKALMLTERFIRKPDVDVVKVRLRLKEVDLELDHWQGELTDPRRRELIGDPPPPTVREDTRFLVEHAEALPEKEMVEGQEPSESLTNHHGPGAPFPDP